MSETEFTITETNSMVDLEEYLNYIILERCSEIHVKIIHHDPEYQSLQAQLESCFRSLLLALPEPAQKEMVTETLSEIIGILEMLMSRLTYRQGLKDGVRLKEWMGIFCMNDCNSAKGKQMV